jgi:hypothetical protein
VPYTKVKKYMHCSLKLYAYNVNKTHIPGQTLLGPIIMWLKMRRLIILGKYGYVSSEIHYKHNKNRMIENNLDKHSIFINDTRKHIQGKN